MIRIFNLKAYSVDIIEKFMLRRSISATEPRCEYDSLLWQAPRRQFYLLFSKEPQSRDPALSHPTETFLIRLLGSRPFTRPRCAPNKLSKEQIGRFPAITTSVPHHRSQIQIRRLSLILPAETIMGLAVGAERTY